VRASGKKTKDRWHTHQSQAGWGDRRRQESFSC
jgi:hypothetical protein